MPPRRCDTLTAREGEIMQVLWERGPATADAIRQALPGAPHDSTVRTLLRILEGKGCVRHEGRGRAFVYYATVRRIHAERSALRSLLSKFFGGSAEALVLRLMEDRQLSWKELNALRNEATPAGRRAGALRGRTRRRGGKLPVSSCKSRHCGLGRFGRRCCWHWG